MQLMGSLLAFPSLVGLQCLLVGGDVVVQLASAKPLGSVG